MLFYNCEYYRIKAAKSASRITPQFQSALGHILADWYLLSGDIKEISDEQGKLHPPTSSRSFISSKDADSVNLLYCQCSQHFFSMLPPLHNVGNNCTSSVTVLTSAHPWSFWMYHRTGNDPSLQTGWQTNTWYPWLSAAAWDTGQGHNFAPIWTSRLHRAQLFCTHMPHLWPKVARTQASFMGHTRSQRRSMRSVKCNQPSHPPSGRTSQRHSSYFWKLQGPS